MNHVLITGASRGVGKGIALSLAKKGYNLILTCHKNASLLDEVADMARAYGSHVVTFSGDLSNPLIVEELFTLIHNKNIYPNIIINNAGISHIGLLQDTSYDDWNNCINTNLSSIFYICKNAIPHMIKEQYGRIINISSVWGQSGASLEVAYSASKGGVDAFTKALAKELAPSNIQVNALSLGIIDTDMNNHLTTEDKEAIIDEIPAGRIGTPKDVGEMILSLLNTPLYLTGQIISLNGGWTI